MPKQRAIIAAAAYSKPKRSVSIFDYYESDDEWVPSIAPIISTVTESDAEFVANLFKELLVGDST